MTLNFQRLATQLDGLAISVRGHAHESRKRLTQTLVFGHAVPMPVVVGTEEYGLEESYARFGEGRPFGSAQGKPFRERLEEIYSE